MKISSRFVGPRPDWANGGVIAGSLAAELPGVPISVRIERPVPVETDLSLEIVDGMVELRELTGLRLAFARPVVHDFDDLPPAVDPAVAATTDPAVPRDGHPAAGCFACGPQHPTGLDLQPGLVPGGETYAARWVARDDLADDAGGLLHPRVVWAALDCPGWYAGSGGEVALLGSMTAQQFRPVRAGDEMVVQSWARGIEGRKTFVGAALRNGAGEVLAAAHAIWITTPDLAPRSDSPSAAELRRG